MRPQTLQAASFQNYPPAGRALALEHIELLRQMPLALLPAWLVQIESGEKLFPVEMQRLRVQLAALAAHPAWMQPFAAIRVSDDLAAADWVRRPGLFEDMLSRSLWQTHQIDAYHRAAEQLYALLPEPLPPQRKSPPLLIAVFGRDAAPSAYPLFTKLRAGGTYIRSLNEADAQQSLCSVLTQRAAADPEPYAHWYVDGGEPWLPGGEAANIASFNYPEMSPLRDAVLQTMRTAVREGWGPELLTDRMRELKPASLDSRAVTADPRMSHLFVTLLTQGSGTQLYSTSFVQAAGVELMRRAQPSTVLLRFAPRRKPASMNDMLEQRGQSTQMDAEGALIDADMALYYAWLAMQRQPGGDRASLLAIVEGQGQAFVCGPATTRGVETTSTVSMPQLLSMVSV